MHMHNMHKECTGMINLYWLWERVSITRLGPDTAVTPHTTRLPSPLPLCTSPQLVGARNVVEVNTTTMSGAIDSEISSRLSPILEALEKLRASQEGNEEVSVPGIVVTGAQSSGKSSVLEAIGGIKLPRGQNITTRVPLILSLQAVPGSQPHALIGTDPDLGQTGREVDIFYVGEEIEALTAELAGDGTGVNEAPIYLKIVRDSGPTITLIDLPGITHNSTDENVDIHGQTVSLVTKYMGNENMVILVVIPAMDDFANAEAVSLARKFDPNGSRTLGVVTKVDNVQPGCGIKAKLRMDAGYVQLNLGFVAVINRTPMEVENDTPAGEVRAREAKFFKTDPEVSGLETELWGLHTLVARIVSIQMEHIQKVSTW